MPFIVSLMMRKHGNPCSDPRTTVSGISPSVMQDDAHIFCLEDQIRDEIRGVLDLTVEILLQFGFMKYEVNLSTRPEKSVGDDDIWEKATTALKNALDDKGWAYQIDQGGGAFYGPKIDLKIQDALGRKWQCSTVQARLFLRECISCRRFPSFQTGLTFCRSTSTCRTGLTFRTLTRTPRRGGPS